MSRSPIHTNSPFKSVAFCASHQPLCLALLLEHEKEKEGQLSEKLILPTIHLSDQQRILLGGLMVNWIVEQQYERALDLASHKKQEDFEKEISNTPHMNWIPAEHIPWLIMELEMNITIREIQFEVTRHMIQLENDNTVSTARNIVMQMNMGEGKTSVILPMLALSLCSSSSSLVAYYRTESFISDELSVITA